MYIRGIARIDKKTKDLVKRIQSGEIAVINHADLDELAAKSLVEKRVKAVINTAPSLSERYPNPGPLKIIEAGIPLIDSAGDSILEIITEGREIEVSGSSIIFNGKPIARGHVLTEEYARMKMEQSRSKMGDLFADFVQNTLDYAKSEIGIISGEFPVPPVKTDFSGKHALIVVRGHNYKNDLLAISSYIKEVKPIIIGVDGGADALMEFGFVPDMIVGDMDSVSDSTLQCGAELIVHAYKDGRAPGLERVEKFGLEAVSYPTPGTSEDIAMLMAYELGAQLIVAVGTHSNMMDFLEKGRKGMASTFLVRMKVGSILVDAKGVSRLYKTRLKPRHVAQILLAALLPVGVIMVVSPSIREMLRLLFIQFRLLFGI